MIWSRPKHPLPHPLYHAACIVALACLIQTTPPVAQPPQDVPDGPHRDVVVRACIGCHPITEVTRRHESRAKWASIVDDMVNEGAQMTDAEAEQIAIYLSVTFGKKVKINEASASVVAETFDIDDAIAAAIVKYRTDHGPFKVWTDLLKVPGIDKRRVEEQQVNLDFSSTAPQAPHVSSGTSSRWMSPSTTR